MSTRYKKKDGRDQAIKISSDVYNDLIAFVKEKHEGQIYGYLKQHSDKAIIDYLAKERQKTDGD